MARGGAAARLGRRRREATRAAEVVAIAERLGAPIITSYGGRGIAGTHDLAVGPAASHSGGRRAVGRGRPRDRVGSDLDGMNTQNFSRSRQPERDHVDPVDAKNCRSPTTEVDAATPTPRLSLEAGNRTPWADPQALRANGAAHGPRTSRPPARCASSTRSRRAPRRTRWSRPTCASPATGSPRFTPSRRRGSSRTRWAGARSASASRAALGAALAASDGPTVCVSGDGGFLFACGELATVAQERHPAHHRDRRRRRLRDAALRPAPRATPTFGVDLHTPDFAALRRAFGIPSVHVPDFGKDFAAALNTEPPNLVVVDAAMEPPPTTSPRWYRNTLGAYRRRSMLALVAAAIVAPFTLTGTVTISGTGCGNPGSASVTLPAAGDRCRRPQARRRRGGPALADHRGDGRRLRRRASRPSARATSSAIPAESDTPPDQRAWDDDYAYAIAYRAPATVAYWPGQGIGPPRVRPSKITIGQFETSCCWVSHDPLAQLRRPHRRRVRALPRQLRPEGRRRCTGVPQRRPYKVVLSRPSRCPDLGSRVVLRQGRVRHDASPSAS